MKSLALIGSIAVAGGVVAAITIGGREDTTGETAVQSTNDDQASAGQPMRMSASEALAKASLQPPAGIIKSLGTKKGITEFFNSGDGEWAQKNVVELGPTDVSDCPGQTADSPEHTMYIRYVTTYPDNPGQRANLTYTDVQVPSFGAGEFRFESPLVTEKIVRDRHEWKRRYQVTWWEGVDQDWLADMREQRDQLDERIRLAQNDAPAEASRLIREGLMMDRRIKQQPELGMNVQVTDQIEVDVPPPDWSFRYDNHAGTGQPLFMRDNKRTDYRDYRATLSEKAEDLVDVLAPIRDFGEQLASGGQRTILGYTCDVTRSADWDAEHCVTTIDGQRVVLWSRLDKAHTEAVYLDPEPCVPMAQFMPPAGIDFAEDSS